MIELINVILFDFFKNLGAFLPNLFGVGKLIDQIRNVSDDTRTFIGKILGNPEVRRSVDAGESAGLRPAQGSHADYPSGEQAWSE